MADSDLPEDGDILRDYISRPNQKAGDPDFGAEEEILLTEDELLPDGKEQNRNTTSAPSELSSSTSGQHNLAYEGDLNTLFGIWVINILLNVVTLGIYRFWGKTRLRRYVASCFHLGGDSFEYLGSGSQMFFGFLKILPLMFVVMTPFILPAFFEEDNVPLIVSLLGFAAAIAIAYLIPVARYMALRYRVSRTSWRGIRGYLGGSPWEYGRKALWWNFLNLISLYIIKPKFDMAKNRYKYNHLYAGNIPAQFEGKAENIMKYHWMSGGIALYFIVVAILLFAIPQVWQTKGEDFGPGGIMMFLGTLSLMAGLPLARLYYKAALWRECIDKFSLGNISFSTSLSFGKLLTFYLLNGVILIATLGLGRPIILQRKMKFITENITLNGDPDAQEFRQAQNQKPAFAEGLDDALDIDSGLM